nr:uncharacterized protein LOC128695490 isoform X1 [Cherax quadricarinatus]XP_053642143.1 uncharacterized protein LOC128695490 isoform X1 [Cherax quadricarinatus]
MDLYLPPETVSHQPDIRQVNINPIFPNRTALFHLHNMAHSRAFFFSYILQSRFKRPAVNESEGASEYDPGFMYYFLSTIADVAANPKINSSAVYFQPNMAFTSSYKGFFNKTMPLFAPRAFRMDDYNDPVHLERISTLNFFQVEDLGAIMPTGERSLNYTLEDYRINEWYYSWLPHTNKQQDELTTYQVNLFLYSQGLYLCISGSELSGHLCCNYSGVRQIINLTLKLSASPKLKGPSVSTFFKQ